MLRAGSILPAGQWPREKVRDTVTLPHDERFRRRRALTGDWGTAFLLDLPDAAVLHHGDGLALDDGGVVEVVAAKEKLIEVRAGPHIGLARLAWHVGNRHLAAQIEADRLLLAADHVIADMLRGLGATVREIEAPFTPEGGAYGHSHGEHGHHHHDGHDHGHSH